jgi:hypothetical protein
METTSKEMGNDFLLSLLKSSIPLNPPFVEESDANN